MRRRSSVQIQPPGAWAQALLPAVILAGLTGGLYLLGYAYRSGYLLYFGMPPGLVPLSIDAYMLASLAPVGMLAAIGWLVWASLYARQRRGVGDGRFDPLAWGKTLLALSLAFFLLAVVAAARNWRAVGPIRIPADVDVLVAIGVTIVAIVVVFLLNGDRRVRRARDLRPIEQGWLMLFLVMASLAFSFFLGVAEARSEHQGSSLVSRFILDAQVEGADGEWRNGSFLLVASTEQAYYVVPLAQNGQATVFVLEISTTRLVQITRTGGLL